MRHSRSFYYSASASSTRSQRRRKAAAQSNGAVTILDPIGVEHGLFETVSLKTRRLQDSCLRAQRWPDSLKYTGEPFGAAAVVWRVSGRWTAVLPPWAQPLIGTEHEPIKARVERIILGPEV
jgi:hypothetical protein